MPLAASPLNLLEIAALQALEPERLNSAPKAAPI